MEPYVKKIIKKKAKGFNIIKGQTELDGYDEYGGKYWYYCYNGWSGRDHEYSTTKNNAIRKKLISFVDNGVFLKNKKYFLNPYSIFSFNCINEISRQEYFKNRRDISNLKKIKEKLKSGVTKCSTDIWIKYGLSISPTKIDEMISVYNPQIFKMCFWCLFLNLDIRQINDIDNFVKSINNKLFRNEKISLNLIIYESLLTKEEQEIINL